MSSKSQIAVEFLMTYGWMIMIALVGIGALAYFGVFNPENSINQICITDGPISCLGSPVVENSGNNTLIKISLINALGNGISLDSADSTVPSGCSIEFYDLGDFTSGGFERKSVVSEGKFSILMTCSCPGTCPNKFNGDIYLKYSKSQSDLKSQTRISIN